jgi:protein-tyrosine phosphatase
VEKHDPFDVRDVRPGPRGHHAEGITLSALPIVVVELELPEISTAARDPVRWLPQERADRRTMKQRQENTILFLCTGNYYRSRFAEVLFNSIASKMGLPWQASSRGLALERGGNNVDPMEASAIKALEARGLRAVPEFGRLPIQVTVEEFEAAHWIVALKEAEHLPLLKERFPGWAEKVEIWEVDDTPEVLGLIEREVMDLAARLIGGGSKRASRSPEIAAAPVVAKEEMPKKSAPVVRLGRETKGRRGKGVTTVFDVPLDEDGLLELAAKLKDRCGTGGTVKDGVIEIQGDQRDRLAAVLKSMGYRVKRVGG